MLCNKLYFWKKAKRNLSFIHLEVGKMSAGTPPGKSFFSVQGILAHVNIFFQKTDYIKVYMSLVIAENLDP